MFPEIHSKLSTSNTWNIIILLQWKLKSPTFPSPLILYRIYKTSAQGEPFPSFKWYITLYRDLNHRFRIVPDKSIPLLIKYRSHLYRGANSRGSAYSWPPNSSKVDAFVICDTTARALVPELVGKGIGMRARSNRSNAHFSPHFSIIHFRSSFAFRPIAARSFFEVRSGDTHARVYSHLFIRIPGSSASLDKLASRLPA